MGDLDLAGVYRRSPDLDYSRDYATLTLPSPSPRERDDLDPSPPQGRGPQFELNSVTAKRGL